MANVFTRLGDWVNERAPGMAPMYREHMTEYYAPKNFNLWYYFGSLAILVLVNQIVTGIFLTMNYKPSAAGAFDSVEYIMRDVEWGWLIRYMHSTGASLFFMVVFLHMFRGIMYGSYKKPRELVWLLGMLIFLVLMAEAFMGYVLPWGNMSFWGAKVIVSLFGTIPLIGDTSGRVDHGRLPACRRDAQPLLRPACDRAADRASAAGGAAHRRAARSGVEQPRRRGNQEGSQGQSLGCAEAGRRHPVPPLLHGEGPRAASASSCWSPRSSSSLRRPSAAGSSSMTTSIMANNLVTPAEIKPVWYFTPFYAIVRMIPSFFGTAVWGVLGMFGAIVMLFLMPWFDRGKVKSIRYRGTGYKVALAVFVISFLGLGAVGAGITAEVIPEWFGDVDLTTWENAFGRLMTLCYFGFFAFLWAYTHFGWEKTRPVPDRVTVHD